MNARRCIVFGLFLGLLVLGGCSSGDSGTDPQPETPLAVAVIGPGGGSLTGGAATVTVPPGAFPTDVELEIYLSGDENPFAATGASDLYRLDGLPASYSEPLVIGFSVSPGETDALIALGEENFSPTMGGLVTGYRMLATTVGDTVATAVLPAAPEAVSGAPESLPLWLVRADGYETIDVTTAAGRQADGSPGAGDPRFTVSFPTGKIAEATQMRLYLEAALDYMNSWPFSFARRTSWPVSVTLLDLKPTVYGYFVPSRMGNNYGSLEFNVNLMADAVEARVTAAHELLHLGQALHDNRNRWTKARTASDRYWLDEACAVWVEKRVAGVANYSSKVASGHQMKPFEQFHVPAGGSNPDQHGYGSAPLLDYLVGREGTGVIQEIYTDIFDNGNDPVRAVNSAQSDLFMIWHPRFQRELIQGDLTDDVTLADAIGASSGTWTVASEGDTAKTYKADYNEGAARFYFIKPTRADFSASAVLDMTLDNTADGLLNVYRYKGTTLERLGIAAGNFQVTGLDELVDGGWYLMVMVTDSHLSSPYTAKHSMTLDLKVRSPKGFTLGWANIAGEGSYTLEHTNPDSTWEEERAYFTSWVGGMPGMEYVAGSSTGDTFTSIFNGLYSGASYTGTLSVTVDDADDPKQVVAFSYDVVVSQTDGWSTTREYAVSGGGIPLSSSSTGSYAFTIDGSSAAGAVSSVTETETFVNEDYSRTTTLDDTAITYVTVLLKR